jgi:hypothetical protein
MSDLTNPQFLVSLAVSILGIATMSWWLYTRIAIKLKEVEERGNWGKER